MSDIADFLTALDAAQKKEKYTSEVQDAAGGIDAATLKAAVEAAAAMGEIETVADEAQAAALSAGFQFAAKVVLMLTAAPGPYEKKDLYVYFKVARNETVEKPAFYDMVKKQLYGEWEKVKHYSDQKAQALYIQNVNTLIGKYGTRDS
ncbi:hypothetical protein NUU61_002952 [Penicillium alfredii]|uniref:ACB domain-containing protein n=1 Tax=Penicillium alfredii TaxID=1506179 RepID=A0A9W9FT75_9EURO|nr:uncharacterized protein NUU61_002952 [Penicillium alfredii]KAJ5105605.1 hypothetical protein NUU61_002952 [Penicillium alfredii]